jgi:hypothetical protein
MKSEKMKAYFENYCSTSAKTMLPDVDLLNEFSSYGKKLKAERVYRKCLMYKKYALAQKIKEKYRIIERNDDLVMAFSYALMATTRNIR